MPSGARTYTILVNPRYNAAQQTSLTSLPNSPSVVRLDTSRRVADWRQREAQVQKLAEMPLLVRRQSSQMPGQTCAPGQSAQSKTSLQYVLARIAASDPALGYADLSGHAQFLGLTAPQKARAIEIMRFGSGLHTVKLNNLDLDNSAAPPIAKLINASRHMIQCLSAEGNNLSEAGVLQIAAALRDHRAMQEISLAHQRMPLSTASQAAMVEAMGTVPTLRQLGMQLRDAGMRWRVQEMQSRATERERLMRTGGGSRREGGGPRSLPTDECGGEARS